MLKKAAQIAMYMAVAVLTSAAYGYLAYTFIYQRLADGSMLNAYLWNVAFIVLLLSMDKVIHKVFQSKEFSVTKKNYFFARWVYFESLISFKTTIYLFYIFVLIVSRISVIDPTLVSEDFRSFLMSIEYGLILVVAFDKLSEHFFKDIKREKEVSAKFEKYRAEKS